MSLEVCIKRHTYWSNKSIDLCDIATLTLSWISTVADNLASLSLQDRDTEWHYYWYRTTHPSAYVLKNYILAYQLTTDLKFCVKQYLNLTNIHSFDHKYFESL